MYHHFNKIHFIGIGGIGMSGIAELLVRNGYRVSGSDLGRNDNVKHLESLGIHCFHGHQAGHVDGADVVVYSSAVKSDNPEYAMAISRGIPVIPRAEMLAELMRLKYGVAVAGAHGKTTTTSMISVVLVEGGLDPTIVVGGRMDNFGGTNARLGSGQFIVVEADESDGSFNKLSPSIAVVTNIDREHMDHYQTMAKLKKAFLSFLNDVPFYGLCVLHGDDPYLRILEAKVLRRKTTYGFGEHNQYCVLSYQPSPTGSDSKISCRGEKIDLKLSVPGKHNLLNALAALVVADELGVPRSKSLAALSKYQGVQRRFQKRGEIKGVHLIDDYAHHPSEIRATLAAAKERYPKGRVHVVFQPHRYSRVEDLFEQFTSCFRLCDSVTITDIYSAGEAPIPGVEAYILAQQIGETGLHSARHVAKPFDAVTVALNNCLPGDVLITLGAGDLPNVYRQLL